jgi:long-subunit fatty acid transport protein
MNTSPFGTARYASMSGSFGALGGDLTTLIVNPAGSGIYVKKEFNITPGLSITNVNTFAEGYTGKDNKTNLTLTNVGYLSSSANKKSKSFYVNFGLAYNKVADFNRNSTINYTNESSSMLFSFVDRADGIPVTDLSSSDPFSSYLAYETFLIDENPDQVNTYVTQPDYESSFNGVTQSSTQQESGNLGYFTVNLSLALEEKFYFGASLSAVSGNYAMNSTFIENTTVDSLLLKSFTYNYLQETEINGVNANLGIIYKPEKWLRLGLSYALPYKMYLDDNFSTYVRSYFKDGDSFSMDSPDGYISYKLRNPGKWILSAALISGFKGLINVDVEWMNYGAATISSDDFDFSQENLVISQALRNTLTLRVGAELWVHRYNFRLGYAYRQNPYSTVSAEGKDFYNTISGGAGLLTDNGFFMNFSLSYIENGNSYYPYGRNYAPLISESFNSFEILFGLGAKF